MLKMKPSAAACTATSYQSPAPPVAVRTMPERASQKYAVYIWTREYRTSTPLKRPEEASERAEAVRISTPAALGAPAAHGYCR